MSTTERYDTAAGDGSAAPSTPALSDRVRSLRLPPQVTARPGGGRALAWTLCALFAAATVVLAWRSFGQGTDGADKEEAAPAAGRAPGPAVAGESPTPPPGEIAHEAKGYIVPTHQILVSPQVSGRIVELNIQEGKHFRKDDVLARLEDVDYRADVERAQAALAMAEAVLEELERGAREEERLQAAAELAEAESQLAYQADVWTRSKSLFERNIISRDDYDDAYSRHKALLHRVERLRQAARLVEIGPREERIRAARADVERAKADVTKAKWRLGNCTIVAPSDGTILKKNAEQGNLVNPVAFSGSFSICEMADLADLEVDVSVQERDIRKIELNQRCRIRAEAYPDRVYQGYVSRLMPIADRAKGAIPVRVKVLVPPEEVGSGRVYLKPEMGALVTFLRSESAQPASDSPRPQTASLDRDSAP